MNLETGREEGRKRESRCTRATHVSIVCDYDIYDDTHDNLVYVTEAKGLALILLYLQTVATLVW